MERLFLCEMHVDSGKTEGYGGSSRPPEATGTRRERSQGVGVAVSDSVDGRDSRDADGVVPSVAGHDGSGSSAKGRTDVHNE